MKTATTLAFAASILGIAATMSSPAIAQKKGAAQAAADPAAAPQRKFNFTKGAQKALQELQNAANAGDTATFPAKLAAAQAAAKNSDDRYFIAQMQLMMAQKGTDEAAKRAAVTAIIASGGALPAELPKLYRAQGDLALNAKDYNGAVAAYTQFLKLEPGNPDVLNNLIIIQRDQQNYAQAFATARQAIDARKAVGQPAPESLYRLALQLALDGKMNGQLVPLTREYLTAYPTPKNWDLGLDLYRRAVDNDQDALLDTFRLMRAAKVLEQSNEYVALADTLARGRFYAEARDVVNEGISRGKLTKGNASAAAILAEVSPKIASDRSALAGLEGRARSEAKGTFALSIADAYYGHGDYAKAADFYRLALQKGSVDAGLVNSRLGMALALSGQKAPAEAAFRAVTGSRADLAGLWLLWLSQRA